MFTSAILLAAGRGTRMGTAFRAPKTLLPIAGIPAFLHSLRALNAAPAVSEVILVVPQDLMREYTGTLADEVAPLRVALTIVPGGNTRTESVRCGIAAASSSADFLLIHDAARPCLTPALVDATLASAAAHGSGVAAGPVVDTIKQVAPDGRVLATVDRAQLRAVQTPQTFRADLLRRALAALPADVAPTDDAGAVEALGEPVFLVENPSPNPKITYPADLLLAEALLK